MSNLYPKSTLRVKEKALRKPILNDYNEALRCFELGGGYNYFPAEWKGNSTVEKDIDSSGAYGYIGLCYEIK
ncbi:hypothetical protein ES703_45942 [subsurface metagenome]